jgi:hypothetical protein
MTAHRRSLRVECVMPVTWVRRRHQNQVGQVTRCNLHGMFIESPHHVDLNYVVDLTIAMPWGPMSCIVVPRFCGDSLEGRGLGVELHVMDAGDRELWNHHYRRILERRGIRG